MPLTHIDTPEGLGLESPEARILFERQTGRLISLRNNLVRDEYLKHIQGAGNPFRVYTDFTRPFEMQDDPADLARVALDPFSCRLVSATFEDPPNGVGLRMVYRDAQDHWEMRFAVALYQAGASEWNLEVANIGGAPGQLMVDFPYFDFVCLGESRPKNRATILNQVGHIGPSRGHPGGVYGNGGEWSMQWHCIFDPDSKAALGLVVKDPEVRNKRLRVDTPAIRISTFPEQTLKPGESLALPPLSLFIYRGHWRRTALEYRAWFAEAFKPIEPPDWLRRSDGYTGGWVGKRGGASMPSATQMDSFRELPDAYLKEPIDHYEWAFHDRGCQFPASPPGVEPPTYVPTVGENIPREDLGGWQALREGIAGVHALGCHFTFYAQGYVVHELSELAKDGRAQRWSVMHKNGTLGGEYTNQGYHHLCPACEEWQDYLASACGRLVRETGADGVRLDSLGFYFLPCYNPAHNHPHPFVYNDGLRQLLAKVSRAVRQANPNAVITTEAPFDFAAQYLNGALNSECPREIPPMRLALPNYRPLLFGSVGPVWGSLSGFIGGTGPLEANWRCARFPVDETVVWGEVQEDPRASEKPVICRLFRGRDHWALVGAWVDSDEPFRLPRGLDAQPPLGLDPNAGPVEIRVQGLGAVVESAVGFNVETLAQCPVSFARSGDDLLLSLDCRWFLIILREPGCKPLVSFGELAPAAPGAMVPLQLHALADGEKTTRASAALLAPGLGVQQVVTIPGSCALAVPPNAKPGLYRVTLAGPAVLGHKRFLQVKEG